MKILIRQLIFSNNLYIFCKIRCYEENGHSSFQRLHYLNLCIGKEPGGDDVAGKFVEQSRELLLEIHNRILGRYLLNPSILLPITISFYLLGLIKAVLLNIVREYTLIASFKSPSSLTSSVPTKNYFLYQFLSFKYFIPK